MTPRVCWLFDEGPLCGDFVQALGGRAFIGNIARFRRCRHRTVSAAPPRSFPHDRAEIDASRKAAILLEITKRRRYISCDE